MRARDFAHLQQQVFSLYQDGAYRAALDQVDAAWGAFPEQVDDLYYWRACLASRLGDTDTALGALAGAAAAGFFYGDYMLRDPDLDPLRDHPEFQRLAALFTERLAAAQAEAAPQLLTMAPPGAAGPRPLLVALHGNGSRGGLETWFWQPAVERGWLLAAPRSSRVAASNRYGWPDLDQGAREVAVHYRTLADAHGPDPDRSVIGGFSRGAALAIRMALAGEAPVQGFIAVAPAIRVQALLPLADTCPPGRLRGYIIVGARDAMSHQPALDLAAALRERGTDCAVEVHPDLDHDYPPEPAASLDRALAFVTAGRG